MIKDELKIYDNPVSLCKGFTCFLETEVLSNRKKINLSLSGGSTPKILFDYWSQKYKDKLPWERINFFWGDERCVPPDNEMNNYAMTKVHLFDNINIPRDNIFRILGESEPKEEAERYSDILEFELPENQNAPVFDLTILGLGEDGHTASIFPNHIEIFNSDKTCEVTQHPVTGMYRITITGKVINASRRIAFLVTGKDKAEIVKDIVKEREKYYNFYPAARVSPSNPPLYWFLDKASGSLL